MADGQEPSKMGNVKALRARGLDYWCVKDEAWAEVMEILYRDAGSWTALGFQSRFGARNLRRLKSPLRKTVAYHLMERLCVRTGHEHLMNELTWMTSEELVETGIWLPQSYVGLSQRWGRRDK